MTTTDDRTGDEGRGPEIASGGPAEPVELPAAHGGYARSGRAALTFGALGVVFGDIGTSPLYAMHEVFAGPHPMTPNPARVAGVLSLVFWALMIIVTLKYIVLVMRAANGGEGGIMALISLVMRAAMRSTGGKFGLVALGIFGASLFYGDGMITPAISVLSAVEGLQIASPTLGDYVVPIALVILTVLFAIQRLGTGAVGALFGPVMVVWFSVLAVLGLVEIVKYPSVLRSLSPTFAIEFIVNEPGVAFLALGSVVLAVTGAEALYADMGHFGRPAIARAWFLLVLPALMLQYMGQGALVLRDRSAVDNPFYRLVPGSLQLPMVVLATLATVIASQAVISGAFSVTRQAVALGFLPRLRILHTSSKEIGQVYVPVVNWGIYIAVVALVLGFRSSTNLAAAYGIAVTGTLAIDTILFFVVVRLLWRKPLWLAIAGAMAFLTVDLGFFAANIPKITHGGWFPLAIASLVFTTLMTWRAGRGLLRERMLTGEKPIDAFLAKLATDPPARVPGTAVFLTSTGPDTPRALLHNVQHNHVLHEHVVLFTAVTEGRPSVPPAEQLVITDLGQGVTRIVAHRGFQEAANIPATLEVARERGVDIDPDKASYFLNHVTISAGNKPGLARWRKILFATLNRNASGAAEFFALPADRVVELGTRIEL
jgi:KUP system potassium uptake protein